MEDDLKKMEDDLKKDGRRPQKKWKTTLNYFIFLMEDDLKKTRRLPFGIQPINQNQPNWL